MNRISDAIPIPSGTQRRGLFTLLLDLFSSVWFGIGLLVLIFAYSSIGSAYPPFRQHRLLEMTEFEWFHWWPFDVLISLLALTLVVTTIRRIPFRPVNAGVWMIHGGILILILGSVYYFSTKVEGDVPVFRRKVVIKVPGAKRSMGLLARPRNQVTVDGLAGEYSFEITNIRPDWPILTGDDAGKQAYSVSVMVTTPQQRFVRQLLAGYPQYTEDIIPGKGRAVKSTGKKLVDEALDLTLDYEPQTHFYVKDTAALFVRTRGSEEWIERPIKGLPHYNDRVCSPEHVWHWDRSVKELHPINLPIPARSENDPVQDVEVRVDGFLRYAFEQVHWVDGGAVLYPVVSVSVHSPEQHRDYELAAFDSRANTGEGGRIVFRWVETAEQLEKLADPPEPSLLVEVPGEDVSLQFPMSELEPKGPDAPFRKVEGSDYEFRLRNRLDNFPLGDGRIVSIAIVEIRTPEKSFTRMVADDPRSTRDMSAEGSGTGHEVLKLDTNIVTTYNPPPPPITVAAGPEPMGLTVFFNPGNGLLQRFTPQVGENVSLAEGWILQVKYLYRNAQPEFRPRIVPRHQRDRNAGRTRSMIRVTLSKADWQRSLWLPFNPHVFADEQYRIPGRTMFRPRDLELPDGGWIELMFSRQRHELPSAVALHDFTLLTHQGGLIGTNSNVRNYISQMRFADGSGGWSEPVNMSLNDPATKDGWWFFQSTWDPPARDYAGMNYTGIGVGNRNGVYIQLAGVCIAVTGMLFAFYVKPIIVRRRPLASFAQLGHVDGTAEQQGRLEKGERAQIAEPVSAGTSRK